MRPSRFTDTEVQHALAEVSAGTPLVAMCRKLGITPTTFYRWRAKHGAGDVVPVEEVRALRSENQKLKQLVGELALERQFLQEAVEKHARDARRTRET